jgi:hypothetical protein
MLIEPDGELWGVVACAATAGMTEAPQTAAITVAPARLSRRLRLRDMSVPSGLAAPAVGTAGAVVCWCW